MHGEGSPKSFKRIGGNDYDLTIASTEGGSVTDPGEGTFTYKGGDVVDLLAVADTGYDFVEWTGDIGDIADASADSTTITMNDDYSILANFEIKTYTVTFEDWDGIELDTQTVDHGDDATAPADPERDGYNFIGWDTDFTNVTEDLTVTAEYEIKTYTVTFDGNGGTPDIQTETVDHGDTVDPLPTVTREGFIFLEWNEEQDGSGEEFTTATTVTDDITVYAQWEAEMVPPVVLSVTTIDDGSNGGGTQFFYDGVHVMSITASEPVVVIFKNVGGTDANRDVTVTDDDAADPKTVTIEFQNGARFSDAVEAINTQSSLITAEDVDSTGGSRLRRIFDVELGDGDEFTIDFDSRIVLEITWSQPVQVIDSDQFKLESESADDVESNGFVTTINASWDVNNGVEPLEDDDELVIEAGAVENEDGVANDLETWTYDGTDWSK